MFDYHELGHRIAEAASKLAHTPEGAAVVDSLIDEGLTAAEQRVPAEIRPLAVRWHRQLADRLEQKITGPRPPIVGSTPPQDPTHAVEALTADTLARLHAKLSEAGGGTVGGGATA